MQQTLEQISTFALTHWALSSAFLLILIIIFFEEIRNKQSGRKLSAQTATYLMNREHATVIDLREKDVFENGHITGAIHLSQSEIMSNLNKISKLKDKPIILVDTAGHHSSIILPKLHKEGFTQLFVLAGGINAWREAGLPLIKRA